MRSPAPTGPWSSPPAPGWGPRCRVDLATEDHFDPDHPNPRAGSEIAAEAVAARGVRVTVVRLPQVHDTEKQGLVTSCDRHRPREGRRGLRRRRAQPLARGACARRRPRLPAGPREGPEPGEVSRGRRGGRDGQGDRGGHRAGPEDPGRLHVARGGRRSLRLARVVRRVDMPASSALTQERLGWRPTQKAGMIDDLDHASVLEKLNRPRTCGGVAPQVREMRSGRLAHFGLIGRNHDEQTASVCRTEARARPVALIVV